MSSAITQTAREILERHRESRNESTAGWCRECGQNHPCADRVAAERIVQLEAERAEREFRVFNDAEALTRAALAERDEKIRQIVTRIHDSYFVPLGHLTGAILALLVGEPSEPTPFREPYSGHAAFCELGAHHAGPCRTADLRSEPTPEAEDCPSCGGEGQVAGEMVCPACHGIGRTPEEPA